MGRILKNNNTATVSIDTSIGCLNKRRIARFYSRIALIVAFRERCTQAICWVKEIIVWSLHVGCRRTYALTFEVAKNQWHSFAIWTISGWAFGQLLVLIFGTVCIIWWFAQAQWFKLTGREAVVLDIHCERRIPGNWFMWAHRRYDS